MAGVDVEVITEQVQVKGKLAELYARHAAGAAEMAYLLTGDRQLAEDLTHDAFIRVAGRFQHLRNEEAFASYLRRTVINLFLNSARRKKLERSYLEQAARAPEPESAMPDVDTRNQLWAALGAIPLRQRAVLVLRYYEDLSERETAEMLRCSVSAVKALAARGLQALRGSLRGEDR
jgi:RNA polymerase sigma-70 factor (sigma-E family)